MVATLRLAAATGWLFWGAAQALVIFPVANLNRQRAMKQRWCRRMLGLLGVRIQGPLGQHAFQGLVAANHISFVDILVINAVSPVAFVAKSEMAGWPLFGWLCRRTETIFIQRGSRSAAQRIREEIGHRLAKGDCVGIFPEGTTTEGKDLLPFHGALFQAAIDTGTPVQPLVLRYRDRQGKFSAAPAYIDDLSLMDSLINTARAGGLVAHVTPLPPIDPAGLDRRHVAARTHREVRHALQQAGGA